MKMSSVLVYNKNDYMNTQDMLSMRVDSGVLFLYYNIKARYMCASVQEIIIV